MNTAHALQAELSHHQALVADLRRRFPDADEDTIADTVEGISNLDEALAEVARSVADDKAAAEACGLRIADLEIRKKRHLDRADTKRDAIANAMAAAGIKKVAAPDVTLSLSDGRPKVVVTNEDQVIAEGYGKTTVTVDRTALGDALKAGNEVLGATLSNSSPVLTVRTK